MSLNKHFHNVFCINLPRRTDRYAQALAEFKKHGIYVEFVNGVDGRQLSNEKLLQYKSADDTQVSRGDIGCTLSHFKVLELAKKKGLLNYCVFEDDVELADNFNERIKEIMPYVPDDYDMLYFGGNHNLPVIKVNEHIARMQRTFTTHAMVIKHTVYDALAEIWSKNEKVDVGISSLHSKFNCYVVTPHIAFQRESYSDILEREQKAKHLHKDGESNLKFT